MDLDQTKEIVNQVSIKLETLAAKLGVATEQLYQITVDGLSRKYLFWTIFWGLVALTSIPLRRLNRKYEKKYGDSPLVCITCVGYLVVGIFGAMCFTLYVAGLASIKLEAFEYLINLIKPSGIY